MFNCYLHGWSDIRDACPICHPVIIRTTNTTYIEPLVEKKPCEHEPGNTGIMLTSMPPIYVPTCRHCGVKLKATWEAEE